jgi:hypothetical protein
MSDVNASVSTKKDDAPAAPPYDINAALAAANATNDSLLFVGTGEIELLMNSVGEVVIADVVLFKYATNNSGETVAAGGPKRFRFRGTLLSALLTDKSTKGRFIFSDGTTVYYDKTFLD